MSDLIEDEEFIKKYGDAYGRVNYYEMAHVLSGRLRQMEKRSKAANKRADQMQVALEAKDNLIAELVEALSEATDEIESWGAYAGEYFQEKHDLKGVIKQFRDIYSNAKEQE